MFSGFLYPATSNDHKKNLTKWNLLCLTRWNQTPTNRGKTATTQKLTLTCSYITNILKAQKSPVSVTLPYFSSFVLSGAPLVIDTNWQRVSSMVTVWKHCPWLSSYDIVHCPWKQVLFFTDEKISSEVYTCCKISGILENLPHENVCIFAIS